ncbi:MAG: class I SAM-dependent methyltransferase [Acidobacteriota bacterium]
MKRRHLIELHEQPWFPAVWRRLFQLGLGKAQLTIGAYDNAVPKIADLLRSTGHREILDLCSGSAAVTANLRHGIAAELGEAPRIVLSDLYPNLDAFRALEADADGGIGFHPEPVDAFHPPDDAPRIRSIVAALHHFGPDDARRILEDAAHHADGIVVLESTGRTWSNMLQTLPLPIPAALITAFGLRPWRPSHLLWGLLLPVIPLVALWDGLVSNWRTYTPEELRAMTDSIDAPDFDWEVGTVPMAKAPLRTTYVIGRRR